MGGFSVGLGVELGSGVELGGEFGENLGMRVWVSGIVMTLLMVGCGREEEVELPLPQANEWISMVPEKGNGQWVSVDFGGEGEVAWKEGVLGMTQGVDLTGMRWDGDLPESPYEIRLEARKTLGDDFFCGLTVPVRGEKGCVTLIVGGWGGAIVGISSIDGLDASENETTNFLKFEQDRWYAIRLEVREDHLTAWIDDEKVVDVDTQGREIALRPGLIEEAAPLGIASFQTNAEVRGLEWRKLN